MVVKASSTKTSMTEMEYADIMRAVWTKAPKPGMDTMLERSARGGHARTQTMVKKMNLAESAQSIHTVTVESRQIMT